MGKPLSDYLKDYQTHSSTASTVTRQAAYAAIAVIWIFNENNLLPDGLKVSAVWIIIGLTLDFTQYIWASLVWGGFHRYKEITLKNKSKENINAPSCLNWPSLFCFWGKMTAIVIGYFFLICYLLQKLNISLFANYFGNS